jgi:hypothetical protein
MKVIIKHNGGVGAYDSLNGGKNFGERLFQ